MILYMSKESKCSLWCIEFSIVALVMWIDNIMVMIKKITYTLGLWRNCDSSEPQHLAHQEQLETAVAWWYTLLSAIVRYRMQCAH